MTWCGFTKTMNNTLNNLVYRNFYNQLKAKCFFEASEFALGME
jgi:hypothetical protein